LILKEQQKRQIFKTHGRPAARPVAWAADSLGLGGEGREDGNSGGGDDLE